MPTWMNVEGHRDAHGRACRCLANDARMYLNGLVRSLGFLPRKHRRVSRCGAELMIKRGNNRDSERHSAEDVFKESSHDSRR